MADQHFVTGSNESVDTQDAGKWHDESATQYDAGGSSETKNLMFFDEELDKSGETVGTF